jgi:hypothetical protein
MPCDTAVTGSEQGSSAICSAMPARRSTSWTPAWEALPAQARTELTTLMIRLLLEHAHGRGATATEATRHEP